MPRTDITQNGTTSPHRRFLPDLVPGPVPVDRVVGDGADRHRHQVRGDRSPTRARRRRCRAPSGRRSARRRGREYLHSLTNVGERRSRAIGPQRRGPAGVCRMQHRCQRRVRRSGAPTGQTGARERPAPGVGARRGRRPPEGGVRRLRRPRPRPAGRPPHLPRPLRPAAPRAGGGRHGRQRRRAAHRGQGPGPRGQRVRRPHARRPPRPPGHRPLPLLDHRLVDVAQRPAGLPVGGRAPVRPRPQRQPGQHRGARQGGRACSRARSPATATWWPS